jgi:ABC-type nitrate/sulfonate/bicarbonate transport system ATPase subunit
MEVAKVVAVTHQHVECVELHLVIVLMAMKPVEIRAAVSTPSKTASPSSTNEPMRMRWAASTING